MSPEDPADRHEEVLVDVATGELIHKPKRSALAGAVDWGRAARAGAARVPAGPRTSRYSAEQVVAELVSASARAEGPVREVSLLTDDRAVPAARIVDRPGWINAAADSMSQLTGIGEGGGLLRGKPAGV